jgi:hypothetical protein
LLIIWWLLLKGEEMKKFGLLCLMALSLAGCAVDLPKPIQTLPPEAKVVAVWASVPPQFRMEGTGMTIFENSLDIADVVDWHMDDLVYQTAYQTLSPRYTVVRVTSDVVIADPENEHDKSAHSTKFEEIVKQYIHVDQPVDFYVVISPSTVAELHAGMPNVHQLIGLAKVKNLIPIPPALHEPPPINESGSRVRLDRYWVSFKGEEHGKKALYGGADHRASAAG